MAAGQIEYKVGADLSPFTSQMNQINKYNQKNSNDALAGQQKLTAGYREQERLAMQKAKTEASNVMLMRSEANLVHQSMQADKKRSAYMKAMKANQPTESKGIGGSILAAATAIPKLMIKTALFGLTVFKLVSLFDTIYRLTNRIGIRLGYWDMGPVAYFGEMIKTAGKGVEGLVGWIDKIVFLKPIKGMNDLIKIAERGIRRNNSEMNRGNQVLWYALKYITIGFREVLGSIRWVFSVVAKSVRWLTVAFAKMTVKAYNFVMTFYKTFLTTTFVGRGVRTLIMHYKKLIVGAGLFTVALYGSYRALKWMYNTVKDVSAEVAKMSASAAKMGVGGEVAQVWQYWAKITSTSVGDINTSMKQLSGGLEDGESAYKKFLDVADLVANAKSPGEKLQIAVDKLGESGASLIPLLELGSHGMQKLTASAVKTGNVIKDEMVQALKDFNLGIETAKANWEGFKNTLAAGMGGNMNVIKQYFHHFTEGLKMWLSWLAKGVVIIVSVVGIFIGGILIVFETALSIMIKILAKTLGGILGFFSDTAGEFFKSIDEGMKWTGYGGGLGLSILETFGSMLLGGGDAKGSSKAENIEKKLTDQKLPAPPKTNERASQSMRSLSGFSFDVRELGTGKDDQVSDIRTHSLLQIIANQLSNEKVILEG